jgi:hypothetical protein
MIAATIHVFPWSAEPGAMSILTEDNAWMGLPR